MAIILNVLRAQADLLGVELFVAEERIYEDPDGVALPAEYVDLDHDVSVGGRVEDYGLAVSTTEETAEFSDVGSACRYALQQVVLARAADPKLHVSPSMLANASSVSDAPSYEVWREWRSLVNMTTSQLERFLKTEEGKQAGLSRAQARELKIKSGHESAAALLEMMPTGRHYLQAVHHWRPSAWEWARRQVAFIKRHRGQNAPLYREDGTPTRALTALLLWGHDPEKYARSRKQ